jgi:hypothetical protein
MKQLTIVIQNIRHQVSNNVEKTSVVCRSLIGQTSKVRKLLQMGASSYFEK